MAQKKMITFAKLPQRRDRMITNSQSGTNVHEIADGIYRINTPIDLPGGLKFNFNQYLLVDETPLLFHTGPRRMFPIVSEAVTRVIPVERLRYIGMSHFEADECGAMNEWLAAAPQAEPLCGRIAAMVSVGDVADRPPRVLADGEVLSLGKHQVRWFDTPHTPHGWDCGLMIDETTGTFFCGDLFTQGGAGESALVETDILEPSEAFRAPLDYFSHAPQTVPILRRLAEQRPVTLACMHGSAWRGDARSLLLALAARLGTDQQKS
jgi:flavorubredoxin